MNGDLGRIYKAINKVAIKVAVIEERQNNNHNENKTKMLVLSKLPCKVHIEKLKNLTRSINTMWTVFIIGGLVSLFVKMWMG